MLSAVFYGIAVGFGFSLMLGTVFFTLLQISIDNGFKTGLIFCSGVIASDALFVLLAIFGTSFIPKINHLEFYASLAGGGLLLALGISFFNKKDKPLYSPVTPFRNVVYFASKGFLLNMLNPANFLIWSAAVFKVRAAGYNYPETFVFFVACLGMIFISESGISFFSHRLKKYITPRMLHWVNRLTGLALIILGCKLFYDALMKYW